MKMVVIEAPFGADPERFKTYLAECILDTIRRGESAYTSVAVYALTGALDDAQPPQRTAGIALGLEWYGRADAAVVYQDHGISTGMAMGIARAQALNLPIEYRNLYPETPS